MTRLPADALQIEPLRGEEWPAYKVSPVCALAGCSRINVEAHHIVRRSWTVGPYSWVRIGETIVGNVIPLCWRHHQQVTEDRARIVWDEEQKLFSWVEDSGDERALLQPPTIETVRETQVEQDKPQSCPTCGQRVKPSFEDHKHEPKRPRKTWSVTVPADEREYGAEILDELLESARLILDDHGLSYGESRNVRYFILSTSLGIFVAHKGDL